MSHLIKIYKTKAERHNILAETLKSLLVNRLSISVALNVGRLSIVAKQRNKRMLTEKLPSFLDVNASIGSHR